MSEDFENMTQSASRHIWRENRINLASHDIPTQYYNIQADLKEPLPPPLDPKTKQPVNPAGLERIFAKELIRQEVSSERFIKIPDEVLEAYVRYGICRLRA